MSQTRPQLSLEQGCFMWHRTISERAKAHQKYWRYRGNVQIYAGKLWQTRFSDDNDNTHPSDRRRQPPLRRVSSGSGTARESQAPSWATSDSTVSPHQPWSHWGWRQPTAGRGCSPRGGLLREKSHVPAASSPQEGAAAPGPVVPARRPSQRLARAPYLRRCGEATPSPRTRGAATAEGKRTSQGLLGPGSPPRLRATTRPAAHLSGEKGGPLYPGWLLPGERWVPTDRQLRPGAPRRRDWKAKAAG